jgi:hypothetical protein
VLPKLAVRVRFPSPAPSEHPGQRPSASRPGERPPVSSLHAQPSDQAGIGTGGSAALEFPQGNERIGGKANIIAFRSAYPARVTFQMHRTIGHQDLWVNEYTIRYNDEKPLNVVGIMEFRDGKVVRERIYFGEPWEPPAWRAQWVEPMEEPAAPKASA